MPTWEYATVPLLVHAEHTRALAWGSLSAREMFGHPLALDPGSIGAAEVLEPPGLVAVANDAAVQAGDDVVGFGKGDLEAGIAAQSRPIGRHGMVGASALVAENHGSNIGGL